MQGDVEQVTGQFHKPKTTAGKYAQSVGEFAPAALGGPASLVGKSVNVAAPAFASEYAGQQYEGTAAEPWARVAGGVAGALAPGMITRGITPNPSTPERRNNVAVLDREGVPMTAGERTGSQKLRYAESNTEHTVGGGGRFANLKEAQGDAYTAAVLRRVGEDAPRATGPVIDRAFNRIGQQFDDLASRNTLSADQRFVQDLGTVVSEYQFLTPRITGQKSVVENVIEDIAEKMHSNGGVLAGPAYQSIRSRLDKAARASKQDPQLADALMGIRNSLDDAMERSIGATNAADVGAWREVRNQYRNMLVVERAATGAGEAASNGIISPAQLRAAVRAQNMRAYARGQGDFADLARAGEAVMKPMAQSGTAPRVGMNQAFAGVGAAGGALIAGPPGAFLGAMVPLAAPPLSARALMSPAVQNYLSNQALVPRLNSLARPPMASQAPAAMNDIVPDDRIPAFARPLRR
jgi:hypothetical protein